MRAGIKIWKEPRMFMGSLRAIENRKSVARSSNDGISCFINQRGEIINSVKKFNPAAIKSTLKANKEKTVYTLFGDYIGWISIAGLGAISLMYLSKRSQ